MFHKTIGICNFYISLSQVKCVYLFLLVTHAYDYGVKYPGYDLVMYNGIPSVSECQASCLNYAGCTVFTYTYNGNYCYLKYAMARAGDSNYISGPASDYIYQGNLSFALVTLLEQKQPEIWSEIVVYFHKHYRLMPS